MPAKAGIQVLGKALGPGFRGGERKWRLQVNIETPIRDGTPVSFELGEDYPELRESVRRICAKYPGEYWRDLEERSAYPTELVNDLTAGGFLAALIPEEYGGAGLPIRAAAAILEEINIAGCTATQCHAQMYIMGTLLRHGNEEQKKRYLPGHRERRIAPAGVRRHRADHRLRHDEAEDARGAQGQRPATSSTARRSGPRARCIPT